MVSLDTSRHLMPCLCMVLLKISGCDHCGSTGICTPMPACSAGGCATPCCCILKQGIHAGRGEYAETSCMPKQAEHVVRSPSDSFNQGAPPSDTSPCHAEVLGGPRILQQLIRPLQQAGQQVAAGGQLDWRTAESALYCIRWGCARPPVAAGGLQAVLWTAHSRACWWPLCDGGARTLQLPCLLRAGL